MKTSAEIEASLAVVILKTVTYIVYMVLGVVGNASVLHVIRTHKKFHNVPYIYIVNLSIADLLYVITCIPPLIIRTIAGEWVLGGAVCNIVGFLNSLFCSVSIWTLVIIGLNRCVAIKRPFEYKRSTRDVSTNVKILVAVWLVMFACSIPPVFGWSEFFPGRNSCYINSRKHLSYSLYFVAIAFFIPGVLIVILYVTLHRAIKTYLIRRQNSVIYDSIRRKPSQLSQQEEITEQIDMHENKQVNNPQQPRENPQQPREEKSTRRRLQSRQDVKTAQLMIIVLVAYFVCWTPYVLGSALYAFQIEPKQFGFVTFGIFTASFSSIINPIIYALKGKEFRDSLREMYRCL